MMKLILIIIIQLLFMKRSLADQNVYYDTDKSLWRNYLSVNCSTSNGWMYNNLTNSFDTCANNNTKCVLLKDALIGNTNDLDLKWIHINVTLFLYRRDKLQLRSNYLIVDNKGSSKSLNIPSFTKGDSGESVVSEVFILYWTPGMINTKNLYLQFIANNFCGSIKRIAFFEYYCPRTTRDLAVFPKFIANPTSNKTLGGKCIKNASSTYGPPQIICSNIGEIFPDVAGGKCQCNKGFGYNGTECQECGPFEYKDSDGNFRCKCIPGYFRELDQETNTRGNCYPRSSCPNSTFGDTNYLGEYKTYTDNTKTNSNETLTLPCKYGGGNIYGKCMMGKEGFSYWLPFDWTECNAKTYTSNKLRNLIKGNITIENIGKISSDLRDVLRENATIIEIEDVDNAIDVIENILKTNNENPDVNELMLESVDFLGNVAEEITKKSQSRTKVLSLLDKIAAGSFEGNSSVDFSGKNIALATRTVDDNTVDIYIFAHQSNKTLNVQISTDEENLTETANRTMIKISKETIQNINRSENKYFSYLFKDDLFFVQQKNKVDSYILSATVDTTSMKNMTSPIELSFEVSSDTKAERQCSFWKEDHNIWSTDGCKRTGIKHENGKNTVQCECDHLTNFAVIFAPENVIALEIISYVGCGISMVSLSITLLTYMVFKDLHQKTPHRILINFCLSLLLLLTTFVAGVTMTKSQAICKTFASLIQLFLLSTFFWMGIEGIGLYKKIVRATKNLGENKMFFWLCFTFGWGIPVIITACTAIVYKERQHDKFCVITGNAFIYTTLTPISIVMVLNCALFIPIFKKIQSHLTTKAKYQNRADPLKRFTVTFSCTLLLGLTWSFGFFSMVKDLQVTFQWLFCIFNTLQGFFIFVFHVLKNDDVMKQWKGVLAKSKKRTISDTVSLKFKNSITPIET